MRISASTSTRPSVETMRWLAAALAAFDSVWLTLLSSAPILVMRPPICEFVYVRAPVSSQRMVGAAAISGSDRTRSTRLTARATRATITTRGVSGWLVAMAVTQTSTTNTAARRCWGVASTESGVDSSSGQSRTSPRRRIGIAGWRTSHRKMITSMARYRK